MEFLNYIYQNARIGVITINKLHEKVEYEEILSILKTQLEEYEEICNEAIKIFIKNGKKEKDISKLMKTMSTMMIDLKEITPNSVARMMMEGSNKGIIQINEKINHYQDCDKKIMKLAQKLLETEERNIEELKKFL